MKNERKTTKIGALAALLLFGILTACLLLVLLSGAEIYQDVTERGRESFDRRTAAQYLVTRMHQADAAGALSVEQFGGITTLVTREEIDGVQYETRIYCYEGWLRELFVEAGYAASPEDGEPVLPLVALELMLQEGLLKARLTEENGTETELRLFCRSGREVLP